jgi:hypothetical protein
MENDMARSRWIYINGEAIPADDYEALAIARGHAENQRGGVQILPDLPTFRSPIDGKEYSGRAGLREHCAKHDVVPVADLAGLPPAGTMRPIVRDQRTVERNKREIASILSQRYGL